MRSAIVVLVAAIAMCVMGRPAAAADAKPVSVPTKAPPKAASTASKPKRDPLAAALAVPILAEGDAMAALSRYCADHLPAQPKPRDLREWLGQADELRRRALDDVVFRGRAAAWRDAPLRVEWRETIAGGPGYTIRKFRYEALPGLWIPALVYMPDGVRGKVPAVLKFHGHAHGPGKAYVPKQARCINLAKRGIIAMSPEWLWTGQLQHPDYSHERAGQLALCGASGLAPFYLSMSRAMDVLLTIDEVDPRRVAITGLSGGGWQTIVFGALDRRAALVAPNAGYATLAARVDHRESLGDYEQAPCDLAQFCDYSHLTAMVAPRALLMIFNVRDNCCFAADHALGPLVAASLPVYRLYGKPRYCQWHVNYDPGTHNYERDNREAFYRAVNEFLLAGDQRVDASDIPCDSELKRPEELTVELPKDNATFQTIATRLAADLPKNGSPPADADARRAWIRDRRAALRSVTRFQQLTAEGEAAGEPSVLTLPGKEPARDAAATETDAGLSARIQRWRLTLGPYWTAPAVEITPQQEPTHTVILLADAGRASTRNRAAKLLRAGRRVLVVDTLLVGQQAPASQFDRDRLALLVQSTGGRIVGISAGQIAAVARWARNRYAAPVHLETAGPRTSLAARVAVALEPGLVDGLETRNNLDSLKDVVRRNWEFGQMPEAFCFGLLDVADVEQLKTLSEDR